MGRLATVLPLYKEAHAIVRQLRGDQHPDVADILNNLSSVHSSLDDFVQAKALLKQALRIYRRSSGGGHADIAKCVNNLGGIYLQEGAYRRAEAAFAWSLKISSEVVGDCHPDCAARLDNLAAARAMLGLFDEAEGLIRRAIEVRRRVFGEYDPAFATSLNNLAHLFRLREDFREARKLDWQALRIRRKCFGKWHPDVALSMSNLASNHRELGFYRRAIRWYRCSMQVYREFERERPDAVSSEFRATLRGLTDSLYRLARSMYELEKYQDAAENYRELIATCREWDRENEPVFANSLEMLAFCHRRQGDQEKAIELHKEAADSWAKIEGKRSLRHAISLGHFASCYHQLGSPEALDSALQLYEGAVDILREATATRSLDSTTLRTFANLLRALACLCRGRGEDGLASQLEEEATRIERGQNTEP
jgi:tetratricopeptide (TPR) repeat protein